MLYKQSICIYLVPFPSHFCCFVKYSHFLCVSIAFIIAVCLFEHVMQYGDCEGPNGLCLPPDEMHLLQQFNQHLKSPGPFQLVKIHFMKILVLAIAY